MKIHLAPMEGVVDHIVRDLWTRVGGYDQCYTEFIRVTDQLIPEHVFHRDCPELLAQARTPRGIPVTVQLLGGDPICLGENAARAVELGSPGIDLNFGCPAPTVNRHDGGASLLQSPERIRGIVESVRRAVPAALPVTAKIRLGFMETSLCLDNALAVETGGATHLTVHCRTKKQMYQPPVDWSWIPRLEEKLRIPIITNGDILNVEDFKRCQTETQSQNIMIGRGALSNPWLALEIKQWAEDKNAATFTDRSETQAQAQTEARSAVYRSFAQSFFDENQRLVSPAFAVARTKQLYRYFMKHWPEAETQFQNLKILRDADLFRASL